MKYDKHYYRGYITWEDVDLFGEIQRDEPRWPDSYIFYLKRATIKVGRSNHEYTYKVYMTMDGSSLLDWDGPSKIQYSTSLGLVYRIDYYNNNINKIKYQYSKLYNMTFNNSIDPTGKGYKIRQIVAKCDVPTGTPSEVMDIIDTIDPRIKNLYMAGIPDRFDFLNDILEANDIEINEFGRLEATELHSVSLVVDNPIIKDLFFRFSNNELMDVVTTESHLIDESTPCAIWPGKKFIADKDKMEEPADFVNALIDLGLYTKQEVFAMLL